MKEDSVHVPCITFEELSNSGNEKSAMRNALINKGGQRNIAKPSPSFLLSHSQPFSLPSFKDTYSPVKTAFSFVAGSTT